ncbi:MAG TPA: immunoglobulin domain-containing protein [Anaerohalosphaeraceae bacterium]|nr:immunoglobulin domain-containing protein [Anaerohalosphaeraceae bacterium]
MKKAIVMMILCLWVGLSSAAIVKVDDFNSYTEGAVDTVTTAWKGTANAVVAANAANPKNKAVRVNQDAQQSGMYGILSSAAAIPNNGSTKTLFFRFRASTNTTDQALGLTELDTPIIALGDGGGWDQFRVQIRITAGRFDIRHGGTWYTDSATLNVGETQPWYNVWMVITNNTSGTDTFKVYLHQNGELGATEANRLTVNGGAVNTFNFRTSVTDTLDRFYWKAQGTGADRMVWVDDIYMMDGESLINPAGVYGAHNPTPANGAVNVSLNQSLSWNVGVNPADSTQPNPDIAKHYLYFVEKNEPNFIGTNPIVVPRSGGASDTVNPPIALKRDKTYYWRVDESVKNSAPSDVNTITGPVWKFETLKSVPVIDVQPKDTIADLGGTADMTLVVTSETTAHYYWYKTSDAVNDTPGDDTAVGMDSATLSISPAVAADEGYYYCKVINDSGADKAVYSAVAKLGVKRPVALWMLDGDAQNWDGTYYLDRSGEGRHADPNGTPAFVAGADGTANGAVRIDANNGFGASGTWNPSQFTGQFTVSLWAKWAGQTNPTTWQGLFSKEVSYGVDTMMYQYEVNNAAQADSVVILKNGTGSGDISTPVLPVDAWEHVAIVFNGTAATIYRNGVGAGTGNWTPGTKTDAPVNIGASANNNGVLNYIFNGAMDDIRVYNYALNQTQVIDVYHDMSGKSVCIDKPKYDYNNDCLVTLEDFMTFTTEWLDCGLYPDCP